ncbi:MAG TPA: sulfur carrier protein ThiS [Nitrospirota bacterium]
MTADSLSVSDLLTELKVKQAQYVTVELNGQILDRENFGNTAVNNGDTVEFLYFMGGGR